VSDPLLERASLVIPVGRDDERLERLLAELDLLEEARALEVVVVDNEGRDAAAPPTRGFARAAERYRLVREVVPGKGAAVRAGMLAATRELRVFTDVDLPYGIEGVRDVVAALARGAPVAVGSRLVDPGRAGAPPGLLRRVLSWGFRAWVGFCLGLGDLGDTQCGLKGFRADVARALFQDLATSGFAFDTEVLARVKVAGHAIVPVAVTLRPVLGTSIHVLRDSFRMFVEVWRQRAIVKKLRARA
jgi:hypothetical protein